MREVAGVLRSMGPEQLLMALIFLAGYALALGEFATPRGRAIAGGTALAAAIVFAALSTPWAGGIVLLGFGALGMGLFSAAVWTIGLASQRRALAPALQEPAANLPRSRATSSSRPMNSAPILNSPAAE